LRVLLERQFIEYLKREGELRYLAAFDGKIWDDGVLVMEIGIAQDWLAYVLRLLFEISSPAIYKSNVHL
jgi:hypothetical protein